MERFINDDQGYLRWIKSYPRGFVVNPLSPPTSKHMTLHRSTCRFISGVPSRGRRWTSFPKTCSMDLGELRRWAEGEIGGRLFPCRFCNPPIGG